MGTIRFLLALSVLGDHLGKYGETYPHFIGGRNAVEFFFIISGFYIALALNEKYTTIKNFYFNRFLKIFPMYWLIFFTGIILTYFTYGYSTFGTIFYSDWHISAKIFFFVANIFIFGSSLMIFLFPTPQGLHFTSNFHNETTKFANLHEMPTAWSLPLELIFYLAAPFIFRKKRVLFLIIVLSALARACTISLFGNQDPWTYRFLPSEMLFFCGGIFSYYIYQKIKNFSYSILIGQLLFLITFLYLILFFSIQMPKISFFYFTSEQLLLLFPMFFTIPFIFLVTKNNFFDRWTGNLSYPIYLNQFLIMRFDIYLPKIFSLKSIDIFIYSVAFAALTNYFFQNWINRKYKIQTV